MSKLCQICGEQNENTLNKFCRKCYYEEVKVTEYKDNHKKFKKEILSNVKKNPVRAFPKEMKEEVVKRDGGCIICRDRNTIEYHHCYFGGNKKYTEDMNEASQIVWLCQKCHHKLHFESNNGFREYCISYIEKLG